MHSLGRSVKNYFTPLIAHCFKMTDQNKDKSLPSKETKTTT